MMLEPFLRILEVGIEKSNQISYEFEFNICIIRNGTEGLEAQNLAKGYE